MIVTPIHNRIDPNRPAITSLLIAPLMNRNCGLNATIAAAPAATPALSTCLLICFAEERSSAPIRYVTHTMIAPMTMLTQRAT